MKIQEVIALIVILVTGAACTSAQDETGHGADFRGIKTTLTPRKAKYFLGENILLDYTISYDGDGALKVESAHYPETQFFKVTATDQDGKQALLSTRPFPSTGGDYLERGETHTQTIPLIFYCRLEEPGIYCIRVAHTLQESSREIAIPDDDPRWAQATIEVSMPDEAQARKVVEDMILMDTDLEYFQRLYGVCHEAQYADFACLQYPVYLPILRKMVIRKPGDIRTIFGITHNPTPEATETLLQLLDKVYSEHFNSVLGSLCDRLPDPKVVNRPDRQNPIGDVDADPQLVKHSWRDEFASPMRKWGCNLLHRYEETHVQCGAYILEAIGTEEDLPCVIAEVGRLVAIVESCKTSHVNSTLIDAIHAIEALTARGVEPTPNPQTPGEIIHFMARLKQSNDFRPQGWEDRCEDWVRNASPFVREFVLFNTPRPLPNQLLKTYVEGMRKLINTTCYRNTIHVSVTRALELGIPVDEILGLLIERLDWEDEGWYLDVMQCLEDLLKTGKHENTFMACAPTPYNRTTEFIKSEWRRFLQDHLQEIRNGKHFDEDNYELFRLIYLEFD